MNRAAYGTIITLLVLSGGMGHSQTRDTDADLLIVGAGPSGLSAALDAAQQGARVTVLDMWSIFGGHGVLSGGVLSIVGTP